MNVKPVSSWEVLCSWTLNCEQGHKDVRTLNFGLEQAVAMAAANQHEEGLGNHSKTSSITWLIYNLYCAMEAKSTSYVRTQFEFSNDESTDLDPKGMIAQGPSTFGNHLLWWICLLLRFPEQTSTLLGYTSLFLDLIREGCPSNSLFQMASYLHHSISGYNSISL